MKKKIIKIISVILCVSMFGIADMFAPDIHYVEAASRVTEADIKALKDKIASNKKKISEYSTKASSFDGEISEALKEKENLDQQIAYMMTTIDQTDELIGSYETLIASNQESVEIKQLEVESKYEAFGQFLRASYENGKQSYIELLLSAENIIDFLTRADNLGSMLSYQKTIIEGIDNEIVEINRLKADLEEKKTDLEKTKNDQIQTKKDLDTQLKNQEKILSKLEKDQKAAAKELEKANSKQASLDKELSNLTEKYKQQQEEDAKQALLWPVSSGVKRNRIVTSPYGWRDLYGQRDNHLGIDIGATLGESILASMNATVVTAKYHSSYGYYIVITNGTYTCLYAHCSSLLVKAGDKVTRGQTIGKVGATGNAYGYHLHFEVWKGQTSSGRMNPLTKGLLTIQYNGKWVDPVTTSGVLTIWK